MADQVDTVDQQAVAPPPLAMEGPTTQTPAVPAPQASPAVPGTPQNAPQAVAPSFDLVNAMLSTTEGVAMLDLIERGLNAVAQGPKPGANPASTATPTASGFAAPQFASLELPEMGIAGPNTALVGASRTNGTPQPTTNTSVGGPAALVPTVEIPTAHHGATRTMAPAATAEPSPNNPLFATDTNVAAPANALTTLGNSGTAPVPDGSTVSAHNIAAATPASQTDHPQPTVPAAAPGTKISEAADVSFVDPAARNGGPALTGEKGRQIDRMAGLIGNNFENRTMLANLATEQPDRFEQLNAMLNKAGSNPNNLAADGTLIALPLGARLIMAKAGPGTPQTTGTQLSVPAPDGQPTTMANVPDPATPGIGADGQKANASGPVLAGDMSAKPSEATAGGPGGPETPSPSARAGGASNAHGASKVGGRSVVDTVRVTPAAVNGDQGTLTEIIKTGPDNQQHGIRIIALDERPGMTSSPEGPNVPLNKGSQPSYAANKSNLHSLKSWANKSPDPAATSPTSGANSTDNVTHAGTEGPTPGFANKRIVMSGPMA